MGAGSVLLYRAMAAARRRVSVGLGLAGAACALLGVSLLLVGPLIIKEQVIKVSGAGGGTGPGPEGVHVWCMGAEGGGWRRCTAGGLV